LREKNMGDPRPTYDGRKASGGCGLRTLVRIETERTGLPVARSKSHPSIRPTRPTLIEETSESPGTSRIDGLRRSLGSYRFPSVLLSKPVSPLSGGRFFTDPFRPLAGRGLIPVIVTGPTT
jgi:hypothetical protein